MPGARAILNPGRPFPIALLDPRRLHAVTRNSVFAASERPAVFADEN
jgi:hypothetical protein